MSQRYWLPRAAVAACAVLALGAATAYAAGEATASAPAPPPVPAEVVRAAASPPTAEPAARRSDRSYYVAMRDGIRIAFNVYFPDGHPPAAPAPTILLQTRYGRASVGRWARTLRWLESGYVVVAIDTRGSTASFGTRLTEISPDEVRDMDDVARHIVAQPWSNGQIVAAGQSYLADTADWATSRPIDALVGGVILESDFDHYLHLLAPGGVVNRQFLAEWGWVTRDMDLGRGTREGRKPADTTTGSDAGSVGPDCRVRAADCPGLYPALQPVDEDPDFALVRQALGAKLRWYPEDFLNATFRDDKGHNGFSLFQSSPGSRLADIRRERKPVQYWGSWMDAGTAETALARFRSAPEVPMEIWITGNDHSNYRLTDPFLPDEHAPRPALETQLESQVAFAARIRGGQPVERRIHYYVLGAGEFRSTPAWPPAGVRMQVLRLSGGRRLTATVEAPGSDRIDVDLTTGTGRQNRWTAQVGVPADYPDRRVADQRLLTYDSEPMARAQELVGTPVVSLRVASTSEDPAFFVYLEDVSPDGRVTYVTEGMLRAIHRKPADPASLPYDQGPAPHSFARRDAELITAGEPMLVRFALFPVAARIAAGHRLRIAIAGADADIFTIYSRGGPERFTVFRGGPQDSMLELPLRPWR